MHSVVVLSLLLVALLPSDPPREVHGQERPDADWQPTALSTPVSGLFAPASGALLARTPDGLFRSHDGGTTWAGVPLPPQREGSSDYTFTAIAVDPTNHDIVYATGASGLYKSDDSGASWRVLPRLQRMMGFAVSPADPQLLYLAFPDAYQTVL